MSMILRFTVFILFLSISLHAQQLDGKLHSWQTQDFLGFDKIGDATQQTGDISSVYLKEINGKFILRLSFDNMVTRQSNEVVENNFENADVSIEVSLIQKQSKQVQINYSLDLKTKSGKSSFADYLLTPENNLLEIAFDNKGINPKESLIVVKVYVNNKLSDEFTGDGNGSKEAGNCAFVHHGNQGLTHTDVFYGNAFGISGLDGSGFDEVLQVHEATNIPGNFHMSGTLMPAAQWHNPEFNDWLRTMAANGLASMMTSALGQHIMPFVNNEMNDWSVYTESQMVNSLYNYTPRIAWVPERVWLGQGYYPDAGVIDWLGDNWEQYGIWGVVLDDGPHLNGYDNQKIHWMNNGSGVSLRVIPINNTFVGNMHYDANGAKNQIASMGPFNICVYGTDWEVAAEMNEHDGTYFLDNYESVLWYCHDNYPGINVWKLEDAIQNSNFNGTGANLTKGTYGLLGGTDGYGGSNNSWYQNWASTPSHSDNHSPQWNYGTVWSNAYNFLISVTDNNLAQLGWYTLMINLHETGWHSGGQIADWEHRYSSHIKNANVYTEASRWADGQYNVTTACYFEDIDRDGTDELVMHNDKVFMVFEGAGGKANWVFYKNNLGDAFSVVSSDMAYWAETDGDYNEGSNNHVAALSDVWPNQQNSIYNINIIQSFGDTVKAVLDQWGVQKTFTLSTGDDYLDVVYNFYDQTGYIKSGWSPDLLNLLWTGKSNLQRMWGSFGSYCGYRNSSSGATIALVLGNGGGSHNIEFEGTLIKGDEIKGYGEFNCRLFAGYTSTPAGTEVIELNLLASENMDIFPPIVHSPAALVTDNAVMLTFSEAVEETGAENLSNYSFQGFGTTYTLVTAVRQSNWTKVKLTIGGSFTSGDSGQINVSGIDDLNGNTIAVGSSASLVIATGITPHTIGIDGNNDFITGTEKIEAQVESLFITWDATNLYVGFQNKNLNGTGDLFINIDTDQIPGSGAVTGSWGRVDFADPYRPEYQIAIEGGGNSMQVNHWDGLNWNYPGNNAIGASYEGWSGNGVTEISVPWLALGNPAGIAVSVHTTLEEDQIVSSSFPGQNPVGLHPVLNYVYAFFDPYYPGPMPITGQLPNSVNVIPNLSPVISTHYPSELNVTAEVGSNFIFSILADDAENDQLNYYWILDGLLVGSISDYLVNPDMSMIGLHTLKAFASDGVPGNIPDSVVWEVNVVQHVIVLNLKAFLEGPYNGLDMNNDLLISNLLPLQQPFNTSPWNYTGNEQVVSIPGIDVVDWMLIELRDAPNVASAGSSTIVARKAVLLTSSGAIKGINGSFDLNFTLNISDSLYVVLYHRDHLSIMSAKGMLQSSGVYNYDFSISENQVLGGASGYKELSPGVWGMVGGDANGDGVINELDVDSSWKNEAGTRAYHPSDFSLDSQINNRDKNDIWLPNTGSATQINNFSKAKYQSQVPQ